MYANYKINSHILNSATTATTINIPINIDYQIVDNSELIEQVFVDVETQKAINPILDYDKVRYIPVENGNHVGNIIYNISFLKNGTLLNPTYYSDIGFDNNDIKFERSNFKESFLTLSFYDSDNPLTQNLVNEIDIYSHLSNDSFYPSGTPRIIGNVGQVKPASQIPIRFILSNPLLVQRGFYEGYHIYSYKDDMVIGSPKYLYMKGTYNNSKTGKSINLMNDFSISSMDNLVSKLYTRYILYRDSTGFYYSIDNSYSNNVLTTFNAGNQNNLDVTVNLYQIQVS